MFLKQKDEQLNELQDNNRISAMLQAIPGTSPPSEALVEFEQRKDELMTKLSAEIAFEANRKK